MTDYCPKCGSPTDTGFNCQKGCKAEMTEPTKSAEEVVDGGCCKTPVEDLLRSIPVDLVIQYETDTEGFNVWHICPIGRHAHEAVTLITTLQARIAEDGRRIEALEQEIVVLRGVDESAGVGYWWCPNCVRELGWTHVTYEEKCVNCGHSPKWIEPKAAPQESP